MKLYVHEGEGHYLGSTVIVLAKSIKTAKRLIRDCLDSGGLKHEVLNIRCEGEVKKTPEIIYFDNGDY